MFDFITTEFKYIRPRWFKYLMIICLAVPGYLVIYAVLGFFCGIEQAIEDLKSMWQSHTQQDGNNDNS